MINRKKRNEEILNACIDVFYEKGIEQATMRTFSEATGHSPATIYQSFKDKREIVTNCLFFCIEKRNQLGSRLMEKNINTPEKFIDDCEKEFDEMKKLSFVIISILTSPYFRGLKEELAEEIAPSIEHFKRCFDGELRTMLLLYFSAMLNCCIDGNEEFYQNQRDFIRNRIVEITKE